MFLYEEGSRILQLIDDKKGGIKGLVFNSKFKNKGQLNVLVCETLKYSAVLQEIIINSDIQKRAKILRDKYLCQIVVYEFLFGKADNLPDKYADAVKKNNSSLNAELAKIKIKMKVSDNKDLVESENRVKLPRYVRVNTLNMKFDEVIENLKGKYTLLTSISENYECFLEKVSNLKGLEFMKDPHVPELLIFPHGSSFYNHPLYEKGVLLLQDKASCLPALALFPSEKSQVIDTCAAPGNKTSYLAAIMKNKGKIFAFDKDTKRFNTMGAMLLKSKVVNVEMKNIDFLKIKSNDPKYSSVEFILVDPSCSGSGIVDRMDQTINDSSSKSTSDEKLECRLNSLMNFQVMLLNHAMTFPNLKKVVYSTCSVHEQENENVVREILSKNPSFELQKVFPKIPSRGINKKGTDDFDMSCCVRLNPNKDLTNGFFVACLTKKSNHGQQDVKTNEPDESEIKNKFSESRKRKFSDNCSEDRITTEMSKTTEKNKDELKTKLRKTNQELNFNAAKSEDSAELKKDRKLLKTRQRPKHKKTIIFLSKNLKDN